MKILNTAVVLALVLTLVDGMGSRSRRDSACDEQKVLPESTKASAKSAIVKSPIKIIENPQNQNIKGNDKIAKPEPKLVSEVPIDKIAKTELKDKLGKPEAASNALDAAKKDSKSKKNKKKTSSKPKKSGSKSKKTKQKAE